MDPFAELGLIPIDIRNAVMVGREASREEQGFARQLRDAAGVLWAGPVTIVRLDMPIWPTERHAFGVRTRDGWFAYLAPGLERLSVHADAAAPAAQVTEAAIQQILQTLV